MDQKWEAIGPQSSSGVPDISSTFRLVAPPGCDIWRSSPERNVFDAPAIITKIKASTFKSISATVSASWNVLYDQGGILIVFPGGNIKEPKEAKSWIKAGIENFKGGPKLGVVGTYAFSDWSLSPLPSNTNSTTIRYERSGSSLWVYATNDGADSVLREVTWAFLEDRASDAEVWVGVYCANPTGDKDNAPEGLEVEFSNVRLETN